MRMASSSALTKGNASVRSNAIPLIRLCSAMLFGENLATRTSDGLSPSAEKTMNEKSKSERSTKPRRWRRFLTRFAIFALICTLIGAFLIRNHIRTLSSLRRVAGTNAYVMDYYVDYNMDEIESNGMDVHNIEDSCIETFFPDFVLPIAQNVKRAFIPEKIETTQDEGQHCSTLFVESADGKCYFARNQDYYNDAYLILRIHDSEGLASIAIVDLKYLNLDRDDLDKTNLLQRIPLLFAPYYAFDGVNRHGVAVGIMSVDDRPVVTGRDSSKPDVTNTALMRLILDNARSAEEAVAIAKKYNVHFVERPQHVMIGDSTGQSGILEHVDGEIQFIQSEAAWQVCTNHQMYETPEEESDKYCNRYQTGSDKAEKLGDSFQMEDVESTIRSMSVENWTMWTSIYNLTDGNVTVGYKTRTNDLYQDQIEILAK